MCLLATLINVLWVRCLEFGLSLNIKPLDSSALAFQESGFSIFIPRGNRCVSHATLIDMGKVPNRRTPSPDPKNKI